MNTISKSFLSFIFCIIFSASAFAQSSGSSTPQQTPPPQQPPAEAGGPQGETGPVALPKKKPDEAKPAETEKPAKVKNPEGLENYSLRVNVPLVNVDISVITKDGQFIPGLKKENFKILEDGVPQNVTSFQQTEAPITAVMLVEFAQPNFMINQ